MPKPLLPWVLPFLLASSLSPSTAAAPGSSSPTASPLYLLNATYIRSLDYRDGYEHAQALAAISGLANRDAQVFYVLYTGADASWKSILSAPGEWLDGKQWTVLASIEEAIKQFQSVLKGAVLYDPTYYPASLVAGTAAGIFNGIPIASRPHSPSSLYSQLVVGNRLPVVKDLCGAFNGSVTGSVKLDAYNWVISNFINTGLVRFELLLIVML